eukprot:jgi/Tetstr1/446798/TSEL_034279.t1
MDMCAPSALVFTTVAAPPASALELPSLQTVGLVPLPHALIINHFFGLCCGGTLSLLDGMLTAGFAVTTLYEDAFQEAFSSTPQDVTLITEDVLAAMPPVTLVAAGPCCEPWSSAGSGRGNAVLCTSIPNNELCAALGGCVDRNLAVWFFRAVAAYLCTSMPLEFLFSQSAAQSSGATFYFGPSTSTMTLPCGADVNVELYIINRKWSAGPADVPLLAAGQEVDLSGLRVFSCPAYVHLDRTLRRKADVAAWKGIYVAWFFPPTTPSNVSSHAVADSSSSDGADNAAVDVRQLPPLPSSPPLRRSTRIRFSTTDDSYVYYGTTKSSCPAAPAAVVDSVSLPSTLSQHDIPTKMYAPVVSFVSIRILLALAVHLRRRIYNMDVTTAFLNAKLLQSTCVDDIIILEAADPAWYPAFKTRLLAEFDCTDAGLCTWLMGMGLDWDDDDGTLHKYGLPVKLAKNEWAFTRCEFVGDLIDTVRGTVAVYVARCEKLRGRADDLLAEIDISGTTAARGTLASSSLAMSSGRVR